MKKIPTVFERDWEGDRSRVLEKVSPGCEWVLAGEGTATRKWDGTACLIRGGVLYARYDAKAGKTPPAGFEPCGEPDPKTGHCPGWVPVGDQPAFKWHRAAFLGDPSLVDGTYELCGPKVQGNPDKLEHHVLIRHGVNVLHPSSRTYAGFRTFLADTPIEGIVFHHPDGRMAKVKARDFGIKWPR